MITLPKDKLEMLEHAVNSGSAEALVALADYLNEESFYTTLRERNLVEIAEYYRKAHNLGNAQGTFRLANCYLCGKGVPEDKDYGYKLLKTAADAGDPEAKYRLGTEYLNSSSSQFPHNPEHAEKLFLEAYASEPRIASKIGATYMKHSLAHNPQLAEKWLLAAIAVGEVTHSPEQLLTLALRYENGDGLPANPERSLELCRTVSEIDESTPNNARHHATYIKAMAFMRLGIFYSEGKGVPVDYPQAVKYFRRAIEINGHAEAFLRLGQILLHGKPGVPADTAEGVCLLWEIRGHEFAPIPEVIEYYRPLAESGNPEAQFRLSVLLNLQSKKQHPEELNPNSPEVRQSTAARYAESPAATWARTAAGHGNAEARFELYHHLWEFFPQEAACWLKKAAENNHADALVVLASCYQNGEKRFGISKNLRTAVSLYEKALDLNPEESPLCFLAQCHEELGEWSQAVDYWERAAEYELENFPKSYNAEPFFRLAKLYADGNVVKKDTMYAAQLMKFAAKGFDGKEARIAYADFLRDGIGMPADKKVAEFIYQKESAP